MVYIFPSMLFITLGAAGCLSGTFRGVKKSYPGVAFGNLFQKYLNLASLRGHRN